MLRRMVVVFAALAGSMAVQLGCEEKDVPYIVDEDEICAYIQYSPKAKQLFRNTGLYPTGPYEVTLLNGDTAIYCDSTLSHQRTIGPIDMVPPKILNYDTPDLNDSVRTPDSILLADYGYLGSFREAVVRITDKYTVQTTRLLPDDRLVDTTDRTLTRYAFFLKLGDNSKDYVGWDLWGYNGLGTFNALLTVTVRTSYNETYTGNLALYDQFPRSRHSSVPKVPFIQLLDICRIEKGSELTVVTEWIGSGPKRDYPLVAVDGDAGYYTVALPRVTREKYVGVVDTRNGTSNRYDIIFLQSLHDDEFFHTRSWCIPYRLH